MAIMDRTCLVVLTFSNLFFLIFLYPELSSLPYPASVFNQITGSKITNTEFIMTMAFMCFIIPVIVNVTTMLYFKQFLFNETKPLEVSKFLMFYYYALSYLLVGLYSLIEILGLYGSQTFQRYFQLRIARYLVNQSIVMQHIIDYTGAFALNGILFSLMFCMAEFLLITNLSTIRLSLSNSLRKHYHILLLPVIISIIYVILYGVLYNSFFDYCDRNAYPFNNDINTNVRLLLTNFLLAIFYYASTHE